MRRLRVLTWHVHGHYLYYLSHVPHDLYLPVLDDGRGGRGDSFPWSDNVHEVPADEVSSLDVDCVLFQEDENFLEDQWRILSPAQRRLPRIYLEHDPPREHPTDARHPVDDPEVLLVHVTNFNDLMWDAGRTPTRVVEHGVVVPDGVRYRGTLPRGIAVVNHLSRRGRRVGADVFERARAEVPIDLVGMGAEEAGGIGEIPPRELHRREAEYRFFLHPIRYTSLGLALCEAMMLGMPVVAPATTEVATVLQDGVSGFVHTSVGRLIDGMRLLIENRRLAASMGKEARRTARERFDIRRFVQDWNDVLADVTGSRPAPVPAGLDGRGWEG